MDDFFNSYSLFGVCLALLLGYIVTRKPRNLPPGPFTLPVIGSVGLYRSLKKYFVYEAFAKAAEKYGAVISVWVGPKLIVVLNGYDAIHQAFVKQSSDFSDRPVLPLYAAEHKAGKGNYLSSCVVFFNYLADKASLCLFVSKYRTLPSK